jgi:hypothetical protein
MEQTKIYKVVATIEFPDGKEEFVIWEPELYGQMLYRGIDVREMFYDTSKNGFKVAPVNVLIELYENPQVKQIMSKMEDMEVYLDLLIGTKVFPIRQF